MEEEDPEQKRAWHQRLFKSASGVLSRRDSDSSNSEHSRQCVVDCYEGDDGSRGLDEAEDTGYIDVEDDTRFTTSVISTSADGDDDGGSIAANNLNNTNDNVALLHSRILMALSLMLILHAMIANL